MRPHLGCVLIEVSFNKIRFISTTGYILLIQEIEVNMENYTKDFKILLLYDKKQASEKFTALQNLKIESKKNILFSINENECILVMDSKKYIFKDFSSQNNVEFPDYKNAIPFNPYYFIINTEKLNKAMDRALLYSNESTYLTKFFIKDNELNVNAWNDGYGKDGNKTVEMNEYYKVEVSSPPKKEFAFGMNAKMMKLVSDLLKDCSEIKISYAGANKAFVSSCDSEINKYIIFMPVMTKDPDIEKFDDLPIKMRQEPEKPQNTKQSTKSIIKGLQVSLKYASGKEKESIKSIIKGLEISLKYQ
jgi:DNA polymerase III sliding clamp (beta) subunit (PCNA family)